MSQVELQLIAADCHCNGEPDLEKRVRKAMAAVADSHWAFPGDHHADLRFRGALAAVLLAPETTEQEKEQIAATIKQLSALSSLLRGLPMDTEAMLKEQEANPPLPLMKWWHEARDAAKAA